MLVEANIIYFTPFYFKNGHPPKRKYFIVLKQIDDKLILASLPTSQDHIPSEYEDIEGCIEVPEMNFNCYSVHPSTIVTECDKSFNLPTFVYGYELDTYSIDKLNELYQIEGTDYIIWGKMKTEIFNDLINCLSNASNVKRKYKRFLSK